MAQKSNSSDYFENQIIFNSLRQVIQWNKRCLNLSSYEKIMPSQSSLQTRKNEKFTIALDKCGSMPI